MTTSEIFLLAAGIVLVIEGAPYAFFPRGMKRLLMQIPTVPDSALRIFGFALLGIGFLIVSLARR